MFFSHIFINAILSSVIVTFDSNIYLGIIGTYPSGWSGEIEKNMMIGIKIS